MIGWGGGGEGVDVISLLKGGCTRFEVENISCNLLLYILYRKNKIKIERKKIILQPSKYPKIAANVRTLAWQLLKAVKFSKKIQFLLCFSYIQ